ncbi:MAG: type II secretion system F family protein [Candidatus Nezhaarchaeales archaeon]
MMIFKRSKKKPKEDEVSLLDKLDMIMHRKFGGLAKSLAEAFELKRALKAAGMTVNPEIYATRVIYITLIVVIASIAVGVPLIITSTVMMLKLMGVVIVILMPALTFGVMLILPSNMASSRSKAIEEELPFLAAYLTTMARGGVTPYESLIRLSEMGLFPAIRREARLILRDVRIFGLDPLTAIERNAEAHPNQTYKDFMLGYVSTIRTGGDILHYLEVKTSGLFDIRATTIKNIADRVSTITEIYIALGVVMALSFYIFFSISTIMPIGGVEALANFTLFAFLGLPGISLLIMWMIHTFQPKTIVKLNEPIKALTLSIPLAFITLLAALYFTGGLKSLLIGAIDKGAILSICFSLTLFFIVLSIPPAIVYTSIMSGSKRLPNYVADFLRDLAEVRKTGLSPEKCIISLSKRDYGSLSKVIERIVIPLSWGLPLKRSVSSALRKVKDWFTIAIFTFLTDVIDVGGGGVHTLEALARFSSLLAGIERELKMRLRPYIFMPYFGAILTTVATLLVINFTVSTLEVTGFLERTGISIPFIVLLFSVSIMINAWLSGLVAGKIESGFTAAGFKHAVALSSISYIALTVTLMGATAI